MISNEAFSSNRGNEQLLLSLFLLQEGSLSEAMTLGITKDHFYDSAHRRLFDGMLVDMKAGYSPDQGTVLDRHQREVGPGKPWPDFSTLALMVEAIATKRPRRSHLRKYVESLNDAVCRRRLMRGISLVESMAGDGAETESLLREAQRTVLEASEHTTAHEGLPTMEDIATAACERAVATASGEVADNIVPMGLRNLDAVYTARRGDYILIGARPSMGKTHVLLSLLANISRGTGPVQLHSIEMRERAIGDRIFAHDSQHGYQDDDKLMAQSTRAVMARWKGLPIRVDTRSRGLAQIASALRVAKQRDGIVAAGIDYLQLMRLPRAGNREQEVATASRELAALAKELDIVLFVLCQLNRMLEQRPIRDRRPRMSDLRESGQLEQDADGILFLFREAAYNPATDRPDLLEIGIAKQRNGQAPKTSFVKYEPGNGYICDLSAGDEMRASFVR